MTLLITSNTLDVQDIQLIYQRPWLPDEKPVRKILISTLCFPPRLDLSHGINLQTPTSPINSNNDEETKSIAALYSLETLPADYDLRNVAGDVYVTPARIRGFVDPVGHMPLSVLWNHACFLIALPSIQPRLIYLNNT